jgi:leucyl-tRNA synthetase
MLAPICPHWAEELYHEAFHLDGSVYNEPWPTFSEEHAQAATVEIAVQIMGKVKARIKVPVDADQKALEEAAKAAVAGIIAGKTIRKIIAVPGRLVNIVAN